MPQARRVKKEAPLRLFKNPAMEALTLLPFSVFVIVWSIILSAAMFFAWRSSTSATIMVLFWLIGLIAWFPFEYLMHRFLFHFRGKSIFAKSMVFVMHGNHHEQPNHPLRNLMPLSVSLPLALVIWDACVWIMGTAIGAAVAAGFLCGYVGYDTVHYSCHQFSMNFPVLRKIKIHHIKHHYRKTDANYAITAVFLDKICHTKCDRP